MNLAIVHYHLNRGGVTRVIENQLRALDAVLPADEVWQVAILFGGQRKGWNEGLGHQLERVRINLHSVPLLGYKTESESPRDDVQTLARAVSEILRANQFAPQDTVVHIHNHSLGKNVALPGAVALMAQQGYALLLQPHDFAEDFRPGNFQVLAQLRGPGETTDSWHGAIYPQAGHIHYAALNGRDHAVLEMAGVEPDRAHLLPNPVLKIDRLPPKQPCRQELARHFGIGTDRRFLLYPVRCIRRKNVGEALLYSALATRNTLIGFTLPPLNPSAVPIYNRWKDIASDLHLPCRFELGAADGMGFIENLAAADLIITTSVAEGFGMVFLESWLAGRRLAGRDLPEITSDFFEAGVRLEHLRPQLRVPVKWVGLEAFRRKVLEAYHQTLAAYGRHEPVDEADALDAKAADGLVDFADLDEPCQEQVLRIVVRSDEDRRRVLDHNPWLAPALEGAGGTDDLVRHNAAAIGEHFSLIPSGKRLLELYRRVLASPRDGAPGPLPRAGRILDQFLDLKRFRLIRT